jgi:L-ribulose-5-phosphate 3-epimerase
VSRGLSRRALLQLLAAAPAVASRRALALAHRSSPRDQASEGGKLQVGLFSRHLQWTSVEDAIDVTRQIGFDAIEWAVRPGGHISPERVETDLPKVVALTRKAGLACPMIATAILDARSPYAEAILRIAHGLGIRYYRGGMFRYDYNGDLAKQLEALKPRIATLVELNQKYGMTIAYHTHSGRGNIGGNVWDLWMVIKQFDPKVIGLNYDTGHTTARGGTGWIDAAHVALEYIQGLAIKDVLWNRRPDGTWVQEFCPIGAGLVDFKGVFALLASAGFKGPINMHIEHDGLLGSDVGTWKLDMPRERFVTIVKYDLDKVRTLMKAAGFA